MDKFLLLNEVTGGFVNYEEYYVCRDGVTLKPIARETFKRINAFEEYPIIKRQNMQSNKPNPTEVSHD